MTTRILGTGTARSTAPAAAYFAKWIDHEGWPAWSPDTEWARVDGEVVTGATGVLKPKGGPKTRFTISACVPDREYTDTAGFPGARLVFRHTAEPADGATELRVHVTLDGPMAPLWAALLGRGFRDSVQADLDRLVAIVEAESKTEATAERSDAELQAPSRADGPVGR